MRLLHTSDWHLGQKFITGQSRDTEQVLALEWLLDTLQREQADMLIVSGDVFDVTNPPVYAERAYYHFLNKVKTTTPCRHVVITGGNHDAPSKLDAPGDLLRAFNIHVAGAVKEHPADNILLLKNADGTAEAIVAALPFLRERDVAQGVPGENVSERIDRIRAGIVQYYRDTAKAVESLCAQLPVQVPVIATGHLYATGASATEEQRNIYLGNLDHISATDFDPVFDYVALGHIHRAQRIGGQERIRYSGSLIPLSFSEIKDRKIVLIADFTPEGRLSAVREVEAPLFRPLVTLRGTFAELSEKIARLKPPKASALPPWLKVIVRAQDLPANVNEALRKEAKEAGVEILRLEIERATADEAPDAAAPVSERLQWLSTEDVFLRRCATQGLSEQATQELLASFQELLRTLPGTSL